MIDYLSFLKEIQGKFDQIEIFKIVSDYGSQLEKQMRRGNYERGAAIYALVGATRSGNYK